MNYKEAYFKLQGELADLIEHLKEIQQRYEEEYISAQSSNED